MAVLVSFDRFVKKGDPAEKVIHCWACFRTCPVLTFINFMTERGTTYGPAPTLWPNSETGDNPGFGRRKRKDQQ